MEWVPKTDFATPQISQSGKLYCLFHIGQLPDTSSEIFVNRARRYPTSPHG